MYVNGNNRRASYDGIYFDSFGVEYAPKEIKRFIGRKNILANIHRIQVYDLMIILYCVTCGKHRKLEKPKISCLLEKKYFFLLFAVIPKI